MTTTTKTNPRAYVACLASYNAGKLHGRWIDLDGLDADDIQEEIDEMLEESPEPMAEEWSIHDWEDMPGNYLGENPDLEEVATIAAGIIEHGAAYKAYGDYQGWEYADGFEKAYCGEYDSDEAYAEEDVENAGFLRDVPQEVVRHFDMESYARELFMDSRFSIDSPAGVYVFWRS